MLSFFRIGVLLAFVTVLACTSQKHDWIVEPGVRVGPINASSSPEDLREAFGDSAVVEKDIDLGEGVTEPGSVVYNTVPAQRLAVLWKEKKPSRVIVCYEWVRGDCLWRTTSGIGFNTSLKDLERLNGRPFKLLGFGWDRSGTLFSFEGGNLVSLIKGGLILQLNPDEAGTSSNEYQTVLGEGEFPSSLPAMQKLNPKVNSMELEFR